MAKKIFVILLLLSCLVCSTYINFYEKIMGADEIYFLTENSIISSDAM